MQIAQRLTLHLIIGSANNSNLHTYGELVYCTILNSCSFLRHMTDIHLTINIQYYNTVEYVTLMLQQKGQSTALSL
jgi:hypothetical protein